MPISKSAALARNWPLAGGQVYVDPSTKPTTPANTVMFNGQPVSFNGQYATFGG